VTRRTSDSGGGEKERQWEKERRWKKEKEVGAQVKKETERRK